MMQQWQVGPVPDLTFFNNANHQADMQRYNAQNPYQQVAPDVNRRPDRMDYHYQAAQPGDGPHGGVQTQQALSVTGTAMPQQGQQPTTQTHPSAIQVPGSSTIQVPVSVPMPVPVSVSVGAVTVAMPSASIPAVQAMGHIGPTGQAPQVSLSTQQASSVIGSQQMTPQSATASTPRSRKRPAPDTIPGTPGSAVNATPTATSTVATIVSPKGVVTSGLAAPGGKTEDVPDTPSRPAKKSRTNTPWTPEEEQRLKLLRDQGNSWAEIAKAFPSRTEGSVKKHWYKDMHYAEFAPDESVALQNAIREYENNKWKVIGQKVGKPAKACEQYAKMHFPDMVHNFKGR